MASKIDVYAGDPVQDPRGFRQCLGQFSTGVTVITAEHNGQRAGVTVNSFASLSLDPALILWSIAKTSRSYEFFSCAKHFAISILAEDQVEISQRFASKESDKFAKVDWHPSKNGVPLITGSAGRLECTTETVHDGGDHALIIGRVTRFERESRKSLIFSQGRYSIGVDHPAIRNEAATSDARKPGPTSTLGSLVFKAHLASSSSFDRQRAELGLSAGEGRVLYVLSEYGSLPVGDIIRYSNLPSQTIDDALSDLFAKGGLEQDANGRLSLNTTGRALRAKVRARSQAREAELLSRISPDRIETAKQVLNDFVAQYAQENNPADATRAR